MHAPEPRGVEPVQEGVGVDDEAGQFEGVEGQAGPGAAEGEGEDLGLLEQDLVEVFAAADLGGEDAGAEGGAAAFMG